MSNTNERKVTFKGIRLATNKRTYCVVKSWSVQNSYHFIEESSYIDLFWILLDQLFDVSKGHHSIFQIGLGQSTCHFPPIQSKATMWQLLLFQKYSEQHLLKWIQFDSSWKMDHQLHTNARIAWQIAFSNL